LGLIIGIALGVLLALLIFKNGKTVLGLFVIGVIALIWMQVNNGDAAKRAAKSTSNIERIGSKLTRSDVK
jgi:hypothetical protein